MFVFVCCLDATNFSINYVCSRLFRANLTNRITIHSLFLFQKAEPAILSGIVLVEWVLANRIVHLYIQHSWKHRHRHRHRYKATTSPSSIHIRIDIDKLLRIAFNIKHFPRCLSFSTVFQTNRHYIHLISLILVFASIFCVFIATSRCSFLLWPNNRPTNTPASQPTNRPTHRPMFIS